MIKKKKRGFLKRKEKKAPKICSVPMCPLTPLPGKGYCWQHQTGMVKKEKKKGFQED